MVSKFKSGIQDCPHCLAHVIILSDGICPRCRGDACDLSGIDPNKAAIWLTTRDQMPGNCFRCGNMTDQRIEIEHTESWKSPSDDSDSPQKFSLSACLFALLGLALLRPLLRMISRAFSRNKQPDERQFQSIVIVVPECAECHIGEVFPVAASISDSAMKVAAHRMFIDEYQRLNES